ncbi:hypothetical protein RJ639_021954 [Escallonia herrerae]|uniref:Bromo domain-containing protein n=1 Tax=Escallonia herrerae TaxID=1293975 RepID=A0AA88V2N6_9ASTE|nr:hypothetical protein RJ639_021954 [Escallonia herrerae]
MRTGLHSTGNIGRSPTMQITAVDDQIRYKVVESCSSVRHGADTVCQVLCQRGVTLMVSENQLGKLNSSPIQSLQFPAMTVPENVVKRKLKIKITSKKVETEPGSGSCEFGQHHFMTDEGNHSFTMNGRQKAVMSKSHKFEHSSDDPNMYAASNLKVRLPMPVSSKRGSLGLEDSYRVKRQKMDRGAKQQCGAILRTLMSHPSAWVFNKPVDPVAMMIPDYFTVISQPMDLGTIKTKLGNDSYISAEEFAADVRLTFSNAMLYNPASNEVHVMARNMNNIFDRRWKSLEARWNTDSKNVDHEHMLSGTAQNSQDTKQTSHKRSLVDVDLSRKKSMSSDEKKKLRKELQEASRGKMTENLRSFLLKLGLICIKTDKIETDIDAFDDETLLELKRLVKGSMNARVTKVESAKMSKNGRWPLSGNVIHKDLSSERSFGHDSASLNTNSEVKNMLSSGMSKSDPDSDGAASALDEESVCHSPPLSTPATTVMEEGWNSLHEIQVSPQKALRAAMLKSRFADTILKAQQKTLLDHGDKADPVKMQQEKERLERLQREEKARIEAQIRAAEAASRLRAEAELKKQREKEREAARIALQKMERTVELDNLEIIKDLEMFSACSPSELLLDSEEFSEVVNPLERLGLFIKEDYMGDEDEVEEEGAISNGDGEEGEIFS